MIYHLEVDARFCKVIALVNGFPSFELDGKIPTIFSKPINSSLIGENQVSFAIVPSNPFDQYGKDYLIRGAIKIYEADDITGPEKGEKVTEFNFEKMLAGVIRFSNSNFNFTDLLVKNQRVENPEEVKDYAEVLRNNLMNRNTVSILDEFSPKLKDYALCYQLPFIEMKDQFRKYLEDTFYVKNPLLNFERDEIFLRSWCDNRIFEVGIGPEYDPLLITEPDENGKVYTTKVYVGLVNGEIKVVR
ncbi:MAG: hypothetical protein KBB64_06010 [Bacteroidia bacterium]|jgi:hypothetical protein|nr:hypothetical protein [Bacteroidia bacterium]